MSAWPGSLRGLVLGDAVRVPVLQADSEVECGAACLAMVLAYHGREASVPEVHEACHVGRDGATARDIAEAARSYGLRVTPYFKVGLDRLGDAPCPAVMHWGFQHFVVLEHCHGHRATIVDPASGRRTVERAELSNEFTGVLLSLAPGEGFTGAPPESDEEPAWRLLARRAFRAPGAKRMLVQIAVASLVLQLLGLSLPLLTKVFINSVLPLELDNVMPILGLGILVIVLSQLALSFLRGLVLVNLQAKLDVQLMTGFFEHVLALPYRYFQERSTGDLLQRLSSNVQIRNVMSTQTVSAVLDGGMVVVYGLVLLAASPLFGGVAVLLGVAQVALLLATGRRMTSLVKQELAAQAEAESFLVESISGVEPLKAAGAEDRTLSHWSGVLTEQLQATMRRGRLTVMIAALTSTIQRFAPLILLWVGAFAVLDGSLSLGAMLALVSLAQLFLSPLATLVVAGMEIQEVGGHLERIASVLRAEPEQHLSSRRRAPRLTGRVVFDDVWFRYDGSSPWAVRGFSLEIEPGRKVALVGRTGSGKSTVAKLLLGLYVPERGTITFDGWDLRDVDLRGIRAQCGVVMQESTVFNGTIRRNIAYNDPGLPISAIVRAAQAAALHDDIAAMPMGYETLIAEGGSALSGGQRQRLAIARALARQPKLLVLDEATSDLDAGTESAVAAHLAEQGAAALIIAHRLSTVEDADLILVVEDGEVVERGTHPELVRDEGSRYAQLVRDQLVDHTPETQRSL